MAKIKKNLKAILLLLLAASVAIVWSAVFHFESRRNLMISFFDVGQGDAIFIEIPNGNQILIDGGPGDRILSKLGRRMPFWDRAIDLLILTHPHADHLDGLLEVLKHYDVAMVLETGVLHAIPEYQEWRALLRKKNVKTVVAMRGQKIRAGQGVLIEILAPFEKYWGRSVRNVHDATIVSRLNHGRNSILFMGDAEKPLENRLLFEYPSPIFQLLTSKIIKVGHHGAKTSSSEEFLRTVSPEVAIIQSGSKNRYGHPTQEVLNRLTSIGARIFRNDLEGDIIFESDGNLLRKK